MLGSPPLPRILCWILTDPDRLASHAVHVRDTWAKHCDLALFMSSKTNQSFPTIGLKVRGGRKHLARKSKAAWIYVYKRYLREFDYFAKADDDTFMVIENLKYYLLGRDPDSPEFLGHRMYIDAMGYDIIYNSGGAGQVLSRKALQILVERAYADKTYNCMPDGEGQYSNHRQLGDID